MGMPMAPSSHDPFGTGGDTGTGGDGGTGTGTGTNNVDQYSFRQDFGLNRLLKILDMEDGKGNKDYSDWSKKQVLSALKKDEQRDDEIDNGGAGGAGNGALVLKPPKIKWQFPQYTQKWAGTPPKPFVPGQ